jgi:hypothetical protein
MHEIDLLDAAAKYEKNKIIYTTRNFVSLRERVKLRLRHSLSVSLSLSLSCCSHFEAKGICETLCFTSVS